MEKGGSFYLQSKIHRAKEMLDDFLNEKEAEQAANKQADGGGQTDHHEDKQETINVQRFKIDVETSTTNYR